MNTHAQVAPEIRPYVAVLHGQIKTTSTKIAEHFGKRHDTILRAIKNLECSPEFNARNFAAVEYIDAKGEKRPAYEITRDGFIFLAMGFTGKNAAGWKEAYINEFNLMESELAPHSYAQLATLIKQLEDRLSRYHTPLALLGAYQASSGYIKQSDLTKIDLHNRPLFRLLKALKEDGCNIQGADAEYQLMNNFVKFYQAENQSLKIELNKPLLRSDFFGGYAA